jgi:mono/diheme cytochrome c family protein
MIIATGGGAMPPLTDTLSPAQVAAYIRTHFGSHCAKPVTDANAKAIIAAAH